MLNNSGEGGHPCLVPDLRENALFFTIENNVCCRLITYGLYYVEVGSSLPMFWRTLIINGCWILSKAFSAYIEIITWFLSFNLLIRCITRLWIYKWEGLTKATGEDGGKLSKTSAFWGQRTDFSMWRNL